MRFELTAEQQDFAASLDRLLASSDTAAAARAWADGDSGPGLKLWQRLAEQGVTALLVPEESGGMGASPVELVVAFEALGRHAVPGPWVESAAYLPRALTGDALTSLAAGAVATLAVPPHVPYALDADVADQVWLHPGDGLVAATAGNLLRSVDGTRRLFEVAPGPALRPDSAGGSGRSAAETGPAYDTAVLACSAQLLGLGEHLLSATVDYAKQRRQFGREIGSYQAIKHRLAAVRIALDFARPLVLGAALTLDGPDGPRDVSAAKVAAGDAAYLASRVALQVHGAIGYTRELDLSLWILKVRALAGAWGTPAHHRARILDALVGTAPASRG